jgi:hypothetical protein
VHRPLRQLDRLRRPLRATEDRGRVPLDVGVCRVRRRQLQGELARPGPVADLLRPPRLHEHQLRRPRREPLQRLDGVGLEPVLAQPLAGPRHLLGAHRPGPAGDLQDHQGHEDPAGEPWPAGLLLRLVEGLPDGPQRHHAASEGGDLEGELDEGVRQHPDHAQVDPPAPPRVAGAARAQRDRHDPPHHRAHQPRVHQGLEVVLVDVVPRLEPGVGAVGLHDLAEGAATRAEQPVVLQDRQGRPPDLQPPVEGERLRELRSQAPEQRPPPRPPGPRPPAPAARPAASAPATTAGPGRCRPARRSGRRTTCRTPTGPGHPQPRVRTGSVGCRRPSPRPAGPPAAGTTRSGSGR